MLNGPRGKDLTMTPALSLKRRLFHFRARTPDWYEYNVRREYRQLSYYERQRYML